MSIRAGILAMVVAFGAAGMTAADTLLLDSIEESLTERPIRGMTMQAVQSRYGAPLAQRAAVGDPPITRWEYSNFVVFFEYQRVIHAVAKRS